MTKSDWDLHHLGILILKLNLKTVQPTSMVAHDNESTSGFADNEITKAPMYKQLPLRHLRGKITSLELMTELLLSLEVYLN